MNIKTFLGKNYRGEYKSESTIDLSHIKPDMELQINTYKGNKCIKSYAQLGFRKGNSFIFTLFQDFNKQLILTPSNRITAKQIDAQHQQAINQNDLINLVEEITAFYKGN